MNRTKLTLSLLITFFFILTFESGDALSQIVKTTSRKKPAAVTIEYLATISQPLPALYGKLSEFFKYENYGVQFGFGSQINVKIAANKKGTARPYLSLGYNLFLGDDDNNAFIGPNTTPQYPPPGSQTYTPVAGKSKMYLHNFYTGLGFEYAFVNKTNWTPFLNTDVDFDVLFGTYRQTPSGGVQTSFTINQAPRFGFTSGTGVQARFGKAAGIVMQLKYRFVNLLGKESTRETEVNKMQLLDKAATDLNTNLSQDRQIHYLEFGLGVVFFIGRK